MRNIGLKDPNMKFCHGHSDMCLVHQQYILTIADEFYFDLLMIFTCLWIQGIQFGVGKCCDPQFLEFCNIL